MQPKPPQSIPGSLDADTPEQATSQADTAAEANTVLSAETDVSDGMDDITAHAFDDIPQDGPLDFDDGSMERPRGDTQRMDGTWDAAGSDSGAIAPQRKSCPTGWNPATNPTGVRSGAVEPIGERRFNQPSARS